MRRVPFFIVGSMAAWCVTLTACGSHGVAATTGAIAQPSAYARGARSAIHQPVLYAGNFGSGTVTEYNFDATGDTAPLRVIQGSNTLIGHITDIAVDGSGEIFVSNACILRFPASVVVFSPLADGNVHPIRILNRPRGACEQGMWVDAPGYMYLAERKLHDVVVFAPDASGNAQPVRQIGGANTGLLCPWGVTTDAAGNLYVADRCGKDVAEFAPTANGDVAPIAKIAGSHTQMHEPSDVKVTSDGRVVVIDYTTGKITAYPAGANGDVAPISTISPPGTEVFIGGIGTSGSKVIVGLDGVPSTAWGVATYRLGTTKSPLRTIAGSDTQLDGTVAEAVR